MLRFTVFLLFVLCGGAAGFGLSERLRMRRELCRELCDMLRKIAVLVRFRRMDIFEIIRELKASEEYSRINFISMLPDNYQPGMNFQSQWVHAVQSDSGLWKEERECLTSFVYSFGSTDTEGQLLSIECTAEAISSIYRQCSEDYRQKDRLYKSVGILLGMMTGIIIL